MKDVLARTPLRVKLVATVVTLAALALAISGAAASTALRGYLQNRVDNQLSDSLHDPGQLGRALSGDGRPDSFGTIFVQVAGQSSPLRSDVAPPEVPEHARPDRKPFTVGSTSGTVKWRMVEALNQNGDVLVVAVPLDEVQRTVGRLERIELVVGALVLLLLGLAAFFLVRRNLRPLVTVERTAEAIAAGDLSQRVPESDPRTEVGSLSHSFNAMLSQIETAFTEREASEAEARASEERMRRFVGDASHELRTPLTSIRGFAELYRSGALPAQTDVDRAMSRVESEASRMGVLVEDLLLLARLDQQRPLDRAPVDLLQLAGDAVQDARAVDPSRDVQLEVVTAGPAPVVTGDAARLRQVLGNLVANALTHTTAPVRVRVSTSARDAVVEVVDTGPGIPEQDRKRVFERFYRADASRTRASGGSGLGLSIVAALVAAHGGTVDVVDTPGGGATFRVVLPLRS
ncbi:MAG: HAMP domain-containing sensor histidine kinase [Mycobacteriales bacterium]